MTPSDGTRVRRPHHAALDAGIISLGPLPRLLWAGTMAAILWVAVAWALA